MSSNFYIDKPIKTHPLPFVVGCVVVLALLLLVVQYGPGAIASLSN